ncbi:hypothetical protein V6N11_030100 [Hibiscus sabdariffa]|uniref:Uncharacterized protein n=1 Tax=Hibiscus sabdariffa TaxID=183260 RepID=A0ABR2PK22_9ROSI
MYSYYFGQRGGSRRRSKDRTSLIFLKESQLTKKLNLNHFKGNKRKGGSGFQHHLVQLVITSNGSDITSASKAIVCKALQVSLFSSLGHQLHCLSLTFLESRGEKKDTSITEDAARNAGSTSCFGYN